MVQSQAYKTSGTIVVPNSVDVRVATLTSLLLFIIWGRTLAVNRIGVTG